FSKKIVRGGVFFGACASIIFGTGAFIGACGSSDDTAANPTDQDASAEATTMGDGNVAALDLQANNATVYVGQLVRLDAAQSKAPGGAALTYGWSLKSAPTGSSITTGTLAGSTTEVVTFTPDIAGDYVLTLTGTASGEMATRDVTATAVNGRVFFTLTNGNTNPPFTEMDTVEMDGKNQHAIDCRQPIRIPFGDGGLDVGDSGPSAGLALVLFASLFADTALDSWEGPPGTPGRAAFQNIIFYPDGGIQEMGLAAATADNTCQKPPARVHTLNVAGKSAPAVFQPRFSRDGQRIAFVEEQGSGSEFVSVVGFDGADYHQIASYCPDADAANTSCHGTTAFGPRRPQWVDDSHLGWSRELSHTSSGTGASYVESSTWEIVTVADVAGAVPTRFMSCTTASMPLSIGFLGNGEVIANYKRTSTSAEDIVVLTADAGKNCQVARSLTSLGTVGSYARDFAVSPDGTQVAYMQRVSAADAGVSDGGLDLKSGGVLYTVPVDGSSAPKQVSPEALAASFGPRWIAAGSHLAWNGTAPPPPGYDGGIDTVEAGVGDAGGLPSMNVIRADGTGGVVHAALGDPLNGSFVVGGGNGGACSIECIPQACATPGCEVATNKKNVTGTALTGSSLLGLLFLARRRTRRDSKK
ncbi:MAG: hypothetical protein ABIP89_17710, partial [Polyangiaceae bacterium]